MNLKKEHNLDVFNFYEIRSAKTFLVLLPLLGLPFILAPFVSLHIAVAYAFVFMNGLSVSQNSMWSYAKGLLTRLWKFFEIAPAMKLQLTLPSQDADYPATFLNKLRAFIIPHNPPTIHQLKTFTICMTLITVLRKPIPHRIR